MRPCNSCIHKNVCLKTIELHELGKKFARLFITEETAPMTKNRWDFKIFQENIGFDKLYENFKCDDYLDTDKVVIKD